MLSANEREPILHKKRMLGTSWQKTKLIAYVLHLEGSTMNETASHDVLVLQQTFVQRLSLNSGYRPQPDGLVFGTAAFGAFQELLMRRTAWNHTSLVISNVIVMCNETLPCRDTHSCR